jgi:hypothetical protein
MEEENPKEMASEKRQIEISDEDVSPAAAANKRIKIEPKDDHDSVAMVVSDKQRMIEFVLCDLETEEQAKKALRDLSDLCCETDAKNLEDLICLGGPAAILRAMKKHSLSPGVQGEGLRALGSNSCSLFSLAVGHASCATKQCPKETVTDLGGVETAIDAMKSFPADEDVQSNACLLLGNLARLKDAGNRIGQHPDGIPAIVDAMKKFPNVEDLQLFGCTALMNISELKVRGFDEKIVQAGGLVVLVEAKKNYPYNGGIQTWGRLAVKHLYKL